MGSSLVPRLFSPQLSFGHIISNLNIWGVYEMKLIRELTGSELIFTALTMLIGEEGIDFRFKHGGY